MRVGFKLLLAALIGLMGLAHTGCASGGYKLTRKYSQFVNKQNIILRIILYIVTVPVYGITLLVDAVVFNTMDFWGGRVSSNIYHFEDGGKLYAVKHSFEGDDKLRKTEIKVLDKTNKQKVESIVVLEEQAGGKIRVTENGKLKVIVDEIDNLPKITLYKDGRAEKAHLPMMLAKN